jgi:hypothetical protein
LGVHPSFALREEIWLSVFDRACRGDVPGMIFTFTPEKTVRSEFIRKMLSVVTRAGREVEFVELVCPLEELKRRMDSPSRLQYQKLASVSLFEQLHTDGVFDSSDMQRPKLSIDTSLYTPAQAPMSIARTLRIV